MNCLIIKKQDADSIKTTAELLAQGKVVIIPTDTVYGFSGIADDCSKTDEQIRKIKGRSETKPLIQLIAKPEDIFLYTDDKIPSELLEKWPGPLTIIVNIKKELPLFQQMKTVAFRCPGDEWLREIIGECKKSIFSTSVNRSGQPVLETIDGIKTEFSQEVSLIVEDGDKPGALPSTLVSVIDGDVKILRQGAVTL